MGRGGRPAKVMARLRRRILDLWLDHAFYKEIVEKVGVSQQTVRTYTSEAGLERGSGCHKTLDGRWRWRKLPKPRETFGGVQVVEALRNERHNAPSGCDQCPVGDLCAELTLRNENTLVLCERPLLWEINGEFKKGSGNRW